MELKMQKQTVTFKTILNWIDSCVTDEQVLVTKDAIYELYDKRFNRHNEPDSILLHDKCNTRILTMQEEVDILDMSGAD